MEGELGRDAIAARDLAEIAVGEQPAVERAQGEEAVDHAFGVAHGDRLGMRGAGEECRDEGHEPQSPGHHSATAAGSSERHKYHVATVLHGCHGFPIARISSRVSGSPSLYWRSIARCRPRSLTGNTLGRIMWKRRNISALQRPMPFTRTRSSITASSSMRFQRRGLTRPSWKWRERSFR